MCVWLIFRYKTLVISLVYISVCEDNLYLAFCKLTTGLACGHVCLAGAGGGWLACGRTWPAVGCPRLWMAGGWGSGRGLPTTACRRLPALAAIDVAATWLLAIGWIWSQLSLLWLGSLQLSLLWLSSFWLVIQTSGKSSLAQLVSELELGSQAKAKKNNNWDYDHIESATNTSYTYLN